MQKKTFQEIVIENGIQIEIKIALNVSRETFKAGITLFQIFN